DHERLEQLKRHLFRKASLVKLEVGGDDDKRTAGGGDALTEQVLSESTFLTLEHVAQGLQGPGIRTYHWSSTAAIVDERIDGLLQQSLLMVDDRFGSVDLDYLLQPVVAVD